MGLVASVVVGVYDLNEIIVRSGKSFSFRIEIHQRCGTTEYFPKVFRLESLRVQPTFPQNKEGEPQLDLSDEDIHVLDFQLDTETCISGSEMECLEKIEKEIKRRFLL